MPVAQGLPPTPRRAACGALGLLLAAAASLGGCGSGATGLGLDLVPQGQVAEAGQQAWQQIRSETPASSNQQYQATADRVSRRVLEAAGLDPKEWEVVVFADPQANAFALPGKKIGVYEGMFKVAQNDAQLAAVIGHEIGHVEAGHPEERMSTEAATQLGVNLASTVLGGGNNQLVAGLLGAGAQYGIGLPFSRNQELEADRLGLKYMAQAGYDPREAVELWKRMESAGGAQPPTFLSTHPAPGQRIEQLQAQMPDALALYRKQS
jgi:predicted Zn-dependent protease